MPKEKFITALDIGASKIRCLIGKRNRNVFDVLGCGVMEHNCLRKGIVVDLKGLSDAIGKAVYKAENQADKKIHSVYVNASDPNIEAILSHGEVAISDRDSEITHYDAEKALNNAKSINIPYEREIFHITNQGYIVDGEKNILDPAGMFGFKLETNAYLVTVKAAFIENLKKAVHQAGIGVAGVVLSSIPTSMALLSKHELQIGTVLIDIGADITEISIYTEGLLRYIKVIPTGGNDITDKISHKFRLSQQVAEKVKLENPALDEKFSDDDKIILEIESRKRVISKKEFQSLLQDAYKKLFVKIKEAAYKSQIFRDASNGVVLSGGLPIVEGAAEMAEIEFGCPLRVGHITELGSCPKPLPSHIFTTAVGLIKYGYQELDRKRSLFTKGTKNIVSSIINQARSLYREYF